MTDDKKPDAQPDGKKTVAAEPTGKSVLAGIDPQDQAKPTDVADPTKAAPDNPQDATGENPKEITLKVDEKSPVSQAEADELAKFAKENGWTQDQANKALDREKALAEKRTSDASAANKASIAKSFNDNAAAIKADKEFGGEKFNQTITHAKAAAKQFADPELVQFLENHPLGSDPLVIRMLARIGARFLSEDGTKGGKNTVATTNTTSIADRLSAYQTTTKG